VCFFLVQLVVFPFVVLDFVSTVQCQEIGYEERLRNDSVCVEWDVKTLIQSRSQSRLVCLCHVRYSLYTQHIILSRCRKPNRSNNNTAVVWIVLLYEAGRGRRQRRPSRQTVTMVAVRHLRNQLHLRTTLLESAASGSERPLSSTGCFLGDRL